MHTRALAGNPIRMESMVWFKLVSFTKLIVYQLFNIIISSANVYIFLLSTANFSGLFDIGNENF